MYNLAKIKFNKNEKEELEQYKKSLLNYLEILDEFDTDLAYKKIENKKVETIGNGTVQNLGTLRDDKVENSLHREDTLKNAPKIKDGFL